MSSTVKRCTVYDIYAIPADGRPDKKNTGSLYGETLKKIWLRQRVVCHTKCCEDAELVLCSSRDAVSLK